MFIPPDLTPEPTPFDNPMDCILEELNVIDEDKILNLYPKVILDLIGSYLHSNNKGYCRLDSDEIQAEKSLKRLKLISSPLSKSGKKVLKFVKKNPNTTMNNILSNIDLSRSNVDSILRDLMFKNFVDCDQTKKTYKYSLSKYYKTGKNGYQKKGPRTSIYGSKIIKNKYVKNVHYGYY